uniref:Uncharacterized protein n=1 Tax=Staphylococcus aureus TaxID=1280 RepID=A0A0N7ELB7_STAAU|nr:hypothetical protein [Staphylococcus aureus]
MNERGFNVHHLTPSKLLSPHTEFFSFTYDTPLLISDFAKKPSKLLFFQQII